MRPSAHTDNSCGTSDHAGWVDRVCDLYERAWLVGLRPKIDEYLGGEGSVRTDLLRELIRLKVFYRVRAGEEPTPDEYECRFPELADWVRGDLAEWIGELVQSGPAARPERAPADDPGARPDRVGRYLLGEEIGRGAMGVVYRAHEPTLGRDVAVKLLHERLRGDAAATRRFLSEARITGVLQHPNIPPVFEVGELADGSPYLAMKVVEGRTGAAILRDDGPTRPPLASMVAAFELVCQAVGFAHYQGIIHRDLKPENVMIGAFGEVQVMDWGLAKVLGEPGEAGAAESGPVDEDPVEEGTRRGAVMGSPAFMAPEQARGETHRVDRRSDVFGLGAILCTILTGRPPFDGGNILEAIRLAERGDLGAAFENLTACGADPELVELCRRCLDPDPEKRPADGWAVNEMVVAYRARVEERLREAEREKAAAAAREAERQRKARWQRAAAKERKARKRTRRRGRRIATALAGVLLMSVVAALGVIVYLQKRAADKERTLRLEAQRLLAQRNIDEGMNLIGRGQFGLGLLRIGHALTVLEDAPENAELRNSAVVLFRRHWLYGSPAFGKLIQQFHVDGGADAVAFSPDGRCLLVAGKTSAHLFDVATGEKLLTFAGHEGRVKSAWFSPEGDRVVIIGVDPRDRPGLRSAVWGRVWDARTGGFIARSSPLGFLQTDPISRDGRWYAASATFLRRGIHLRVLGEDKSGRKRLGGEALALAISPNGQKVAAARMDKGIPGLRLGIGSDSDRNTAYIVETPTDREIPLFWNETDTAIPDSVLLDASVLGSWSFSPDGSRFILGGKEPRVWDTTTGRLLSPHSWAGGNSLSEGEPQFSPDGRRVALGSSNGKVTIRATDTGAVLAVLLGDGGGMRPVSFSPDGRRVLTFGSNDTAQVWDSRSGRLLGVLPNDGMSSGSAWVSGQYLKHVVRPEFLALLAEQGLSSAAFGPDSRHVATACGGVVRVWDAETPGGRPAGVRPPPPAPPERSPDGSCYVRRPTLLDTPRSDGAHWTLQVLQVANDEPVSSLAGSEGFVFRGFSAGSTRVAATRRNSLRVWDAETGTPVGPLLTHSDEVLFAAFGPDGTTLATGCKDGTAQLWDAATGRRLSPQLRHEGEVISAEFSADGGSLTTWTGSGQAWVWDIGLADWSAEETVKRAKLASGRRIGQAGEVASLPASELMQLWHELRPRLASDSSTGDEQVRSWRRREIRDCLREGDLAAAQFHYWAQVADAARAGGK